MKRFEGRDFTDLWLEEESEPVHDVEVVNSSFLNCFSAPRGDCKPQAVFRNIVVRNCKYQACDLYTATLEDVFVDGFTQSGRHPMFMQGCRFKHVKFAGRIGSPLIRHLPDLEYPEDRIKSWIATQQEFYRGVDWAVDITAAKFTTLVEFEGIPADLVIAEPGSYVRIKRARILSSSFQYDRLHSLSQIIVDGFMELGLPDLVVAAGLGGRDPRHELEALQLLRDSGAAPPN